MLQYHHNVSCLTKRGLLIPIMFSLSFPGKPQGLSQENQRGNLILRFSYSRQSSGKRFNVLRYESGINSKRKFYRFIVLFIYRLFKSRFVKLKIAGMQFLLSLFPSSHCILLSRIDCLKASFHFDLDIVTELLITKYDSANVQQDGK